MEVKKASYIIVLLVVCSTLYFTLTILPESVGATTHFVGGGGPGNYTTIQSAIDAAIPGDTILVYSGTYYELISINKALSLRGEDKSTTIITAPFGAVVVTADLVNFSEFSIDAGYPITLISVQNCSITDIIISGSSEGILLDSSNRNTISHSIISASYGIHLDNSHRNLIHNNTMDNNNLGILLDSSNENILHNNSIINGQYGGMSIRYSMHNELKNNSFVGSGIDLQGWPVETWNTHIIDASNTVNGRPVHYHKNATGGAISSPGGQVILANCTDVTVESQNSSEASIGIQLGFSSNNTILNATTSSNLLHGLAIYYSYGNMIKNSSISSNQGHGILLKNSGENTIENNSISINDRSGIQFEHSDRFNNIINNTFFRNSEPDVYFWYSSYNNITLNNFSQGFGERVLLEYARGNDVSHNHFDWSDRAIVVRYFGSNTICNNTALYGWHGIQLHDSNRNTIVDNHISHMSTGISIGGLDNVVERNNVSHSSSGISLGSPNFVGNNTLYSNQYGMRISYSDQTTIFNNTIIDSYVGIYFRHADYGTISSNVVIDGYYGIYIHYLDNSVVVGNTVTRNEYGMFINSSVGDSILENIVSENVNGFFLYGSANNSIYHNEILNNANQAIDHSDSNQWDNGYPPGGNYWSDYIGVDHMKGPNQDQPGRDEIGDSPYIIDADSQDRYPLMNPYSIRPRPPIILDAALTGSNWKDVRLSWSLSFDDGEGDNSVIGYRIYRGSSYDSEGSGYQLISLTPNGTKEFVDGMAGEGDSSNYFYRVCAVDFDSNISCSSQQASKFTNPLVQGLNLVSIPLLQSNESVAEVLKTTSFNEAWFFDSTDRLWRSYIEAKPYHGELRFLNNTMALWVNVTNDSNLTVAGLVPMSTDIQLRAGWNLIGFPSFSTQYTVADLKAVVAVERIEGFDPVTPPYFLRVMSDGDFLQAGFGYWIRVGSPIVWTVENT